MTRAARPSASQRPTISVPNAGAITVDANTAAASRGTSASGARDEADAQAGATAFDTPVM